MDITFVQKIWYLHTYILYSANFGGENFGEFGEMNVICQYFTHPNSRFTKVANISYCKFHQHFPHQNSEMIDSPKFYPAKIFRYMVCTF